MGAQIRTEMVGLISSTFSQMIKLNGMIQMVMGLVIIQEGLTLTNVQMMLVLPKKMDALRTSKRRPTVSYNTVDGLLDFLLYL